MWYFSWILGLGLACAFAILNAMWYEVHATDEAPIASVRERNCRIVDVEPAPISTWPSVPPASASISSASFGTPR
jgi:cyd operon protein YbgT